MKVPYRTELGTQFNEGARLAWIAKEGRGLSNADLARQLGCSRAHLGKILYGDQKPGRELSTKFTDVLGVPPGAWDAAVTESFVLPAARPSESGPTLSSDAPAPTGTDSS